MIEKHMANGFNIQKLNYYYCSTIDKNYAEVLAFIYIHLDI